ncbi:MAG: response regulator, partial [Sneathiella sp.]
AFKQSETGRTSRMGSGLGLSISKNLTNMIKGKIEVKSKVGQGTTFTMWIDVAIAKEQKAPVQECSEVNIASPLKILVAEDNDINQMIIEEMLTSDGHDFVLAENGDEAVKKACQNGLSFDLILMDIQMPVMNGIEATKAIRRQIPDTEILPIYALTANAFKNQMDEYEAAGMQGTLTKPIDRPKLRSVLLRISDHKKEMELNTVVDIPLGKQAL